MSTVMVPGDRRARTASTLAGFAALITSTGTSGPASARTCRSTSAACCSSAARSALVSTTATAAPVSKASTSSRSRRRRFTSLMGWATIT